MAPSEFPASWGTPISILKPLKGIDKGLYENLESFFRLDYPAYELLFAVESSKDPAVPVVRELMGRYPHIRARLYDRAIEVGPNPKVNNLMVPYEQASFDWLLISDSNMRVGKDYLSRLVMQMGPGVGLVTAVVAGVGARHLGGKLEGVYLNTFYARWMHLAGFFGQSFVVGKTMLMRRSDAERFGGLRSLGRYIAEDYMAGEAMKRLGLSVKVMQDPVPQHIGHYSFKNFWLRHLRWGRIRKSQVPALFLLEPFQSMVPSAVAGGVVVTLLAPSILPAFLVAHCALWFAFDAWMIRAVSGQCRLEDLAAWFCRECLAFPLWVHMSLSSTVNWRGAKLRIRAGGLLEDSWQDLKAEGEFYGTSGIAAELSLGSCHQ